MEYLTAEKIAELTNDLDGIANIRAINKLYREQDESSLWPINGAFNATERAIRRVRKMGYAIYGLEYAYALDYEMSAIVNDPDL